MGKVGFGSKWLLWGGLLLAACDPYTPQERGIEVNEDITIAHQSAAMFVAQFTVEDHYGYDFGDLFLDSVVYWTDTYCPGTTEYAVVYEGQCAHGLMYNCYEMYVALSNSNPEKITGSALLHEFGHCMLQEMNGSPYLGDVDHIDLEFWTTLDEAEAFVRNRGW